MGSVRTLTLTRRSRNAPLCRLFAESADHTLGLTAVLFWNPTACSNATAASYSWIKTCSAYRQRKRNQTIAVLVATG